MVYLKIFGDFKHYLLRGNYLEYGGLTTFTGSPFGTSKNSFGSWGQLTKVGLKGHLKLNEGQRNYRGPFIRTGDTFLNP